MKPPAIFSKLDFVTRRRTPVILQSEAAECGLACLAMVAGHHGHDIDLAGTRRLFSVSLTGVTLKDVMTAAGLMNLAPRGLRAELDALDKLRLPAILHWDLNHFVVLTRVQGDKLTLNDPAFGERKLTRSEASSHFTGVVLELTPTTGFKRGKFANPMKFSDLFGDPRRLVGPLTQVFLLSLILQAAAIVGPFYNQLVVDEVLTRYDADLLPVLAIGFGLVKLINMGVGALRSYIQLYLGSTIGYQLEVTVFQRLIRLDLPFFEKRHLGDVMSRFGAIEPINDLLTHGVVGSIVDGLLVITMAALIFYYSVTLASVVVGALVIYIAYRIARYRYIRLQSLGLIVAKAKEQTTFMENLRAIRAIKIFGRETERQNLWQNLYSKTLNIGFRVNRANVYFDMARDFLFGLEDIVIVYLAANMVMNKTFTVGMVFAFVSYKDYFVGKALSVTDMVLKFKLLELQLARLADICLTPPERGLAAPSVRRDLGGSLGLSKVAFRYSDADRLIFENLDFEIAPGESVAITGPSGCGKSTLLKVMLGLLPPTRGRVLVDGLDLATFGLSNFRRQVGAVMQDDTLLSGSIADNIAFFAPNIDMGWVRECAKIAAVDDEIMRMPMAYHTLTGDMGTVFSGGQKSRILLARALYSRPRILMLDEGTAHLDLATEARVNQGVAALDIARIIIAHRPQTIQSADRIVRLDATGLIEMADRRPVRKEGSLALEGIHSLATVAPFRHPKTAPSLLLRAKSQPELG